MIVRKLAVALMTSFFIALPAIAQTKADTENNGHHYSGGPKTVVPHHMGKKTTSTTASRKSGGHHYSGGPATSTPHHMGEKQ